MKLHVSVGLAILFLSACVAFAERINHEGRILGPPPVVTEAVLFNTTNADAILAAMQICPVTSAWNENISTRPVLTNSDAMIAQIIADLCADRRALIAFQEMNFALVPTNQPLVPILFTDYPDESDLNGGSYPSGLYPIPTNQPIEGWPSQVSYTLAVWQATDDGSDRHAIMVQPENGNLFETWRGLRTGTTWSAANGAVFSLNSNALRPAGWTSGYAAGLPMFPALPRFDECERGVVEHACRIVVKRTRYNTYLYPANHYASVSSNTSTNLPAMGQRVRLKSSFVIPANWTKQEKAVLTALKKYGALVSDNGNFFSISVTPDDRWPAGCFDHFTSIGITNFEIIQTTGPNEGPRAGGAPSASAGPDATVVVGQPFSLQGFVSFTNPVTAIQWKRYSGPTNLTFANAALTNSTVTFNTPGTFTLMLSADDGVHAVAFDAVVITAAAAQAPVSLTIALVGTNVNLNWTGGNAPFVIEQADSVTGAWSSVVTNAQPFFTLPITSASRFFRLRGS